MRKQGAVPPDKPRCCLGSDLAGRRYRTLCRPREHQFRKPSLPLIGEGNIVCGKLAETAGDSGGVLAAAREEGVHAELEKPSWPRGRNPAEQRCWKALWPEGGRRARSSEEPLVMQRDPAASGGRRKEVSLKASRRGQAGRDSVTEAREGKG